MQRRDAGFSLLELLVVVAIVGVIAALAIPGLLHARMVGNETSAIGSMKALLQAEVIYAATCGNDGYAASFLVLGTPTPATTEPFLPADLTSSLTPQKSGYIFTLGPGAVVVKGPTDCNGTATHRTFYATAAPQTFNTSGSRSFAANQTKTIWQLNAAAPPTEPFGPPAKPIL